MQTKHFFESRNFKNRRKLINLFTCAIEFSIIFMRYSDRPLLLGSGSLLLNSVFPTEMGNNFKTTDNFAEIYTSCVHKLTSLPRKQCFDVNFQTCDNTFQSSVYGSKDTKWSVLTEKVVLMFQLERNCVLEKLEIYLFLPLLL